LLLFDSIVLIYGSWNYYYYYCFLTLSEISQAFVTSFGAIVVTNDTPLDTLLQWNDWTHEHGKAGLANGVNSNILFLLALTNGVTATFFSDFGPKHAVTDANGEPPISNPVDSIEVVEGENGEHHLVITVTRTKHDLGMRPTLLCFSFLSVLSFPFLVFFVSLSSCPLSHLQTTTSGSPSPTWLA
jgi:hypothetical protein